MARNAQGTITEVTNFINHSANRVALLQTLIQESFGDETQKRRLKTLCTTRWVERHECILTFCELLPAIRDLLRHYESGNDTNATAKSLTLQKGICDSGFIVSLCVMKDILSVTLQLSILLQKVDSDLCRAVSYIENVIQILKNRRSDVEQSFGIVWNEAKNIAEKLDVELKKPRVAGRQLYRVNVPSSSDSDEEYFRIALYIPYLDYVIAELERRFQQHNAVALKFGILIPNKSGSTSTTAVSELESLSNVYAKFTDRNQVFSEYEIWQESWKNINDPPITLLSALEKCDKMLFPNIHTLLRIGVTMPITTATAERSFSTLRRLKTYLRTTMTADRLSSLAIIHVHRGIEINAEDVIDKFALEGKHRLEFVL